jgi:large repetitive protein
VSLKRLLALIAFACVTAAVLVSAAPAGGIRDWEPCPDAGGTLTCPPGTVGVPYTIKFRAVEEPPCRPGDDVWVIDNGSPPPGLSLGTDGTLSGTPTQAGTWTFWVEMQLPDIEGVCNGTADTTQEQFSIPINPGTPALPKLTIGPEQSGVGPGTVGAPYTLAMTANLSDAKTWSIVNGALPPGLALGATDGLISGTPTAEGTYSFMVRAALADDRSDTKVLGITVRSPMAIANAETPASEVGVRFLLPLAATGGTGTFAWSLTSGTLPPGLVFAPNGAIAGRPRTPGAYPFTATVTDTEGRTASYTSTVAVAERLDIVTRRFRSGKVGRYYQARLRSSGGVTPATWRIKRGPLPRGVSFDRERGLFYGTPRRARTYRIAVEIRDSLRVRATETVVLVVKAAKKPKKKR